MKPPLTTGLAAATSKTGRPARWTRLLASDLWHDFVHSRTAVLAAAIALLCLCGALFAPWLAPHDPSDLAGLDLADSHLPPAWLTDGRATYPLGTDDQGRDILSALLYGARISLMVGLSAVALSVLIGVTAGLVAGFAGGIVDAALMRLCDVMLSFPPILIALLIDGVGRAIFPQARDVLAFAVLILALTLTDWVRYARMVRGSTLVERNKEYVQAARLVGLSRWRLLRRHVLPNVLGPVLVLATIQVGQAIVAEATLSYLGVGVPPTNPSLGTLIRIGNDFLYAGEWWITLFPGAALVLIAMSVNLLGDWLRDALNPRLQ
ncbi:ABC transporter permease [Scleromatobacter humisilvae]|uniref:ABC transporter permease n=1 Tax=Scleromatobacter humisilvae TaxID=2897159 RepID=A0A9X1YMG8_9BURK|nr:ABC transporter permease [Scleromatobacter humisilvae]MCK9688994.1 ABC transporter permease [Scleromatobacter humisilvae]